MNGFAGSRVMHLMHDVIDHPWLFQELRDSGLFDRYSNFLDSVDFTDDSFLYSRQAELIATVGFGSRRWNVTKETDDPLLLGDEDISTLLSGNTDEKVENSLDIYRAKNENERSWIRFIVENMALQIADERRRYGSVKQRDPRTGDMSPMKLLDPIYLAFLVEATSHLQGLSDYRGRQVEAASLVEGILETLVSGHLAQDQLRVMPPSRNRHSKNKIDQNKEDWFKNNLGDLTVYNKD
jgi:hypothetical protein